MINTLAYFNDEKLSKLFYDDNLQYIDFSGERETSLREKNNIFEIKIENHQMFLKFMYIFLKQAILYIVAQQSMD